MLPFDHPDPELMSAILEPLLDDFRYWLSRAQRLLENEEISFFESEQQADLLARVHQTMQEVDAARVLLNVTDHQVGIENSVVMGWHRLVAETWQVMILHRVGSSDQAELF